MNKFITNNKYTVMYLEPGDTCWWCGIITILIICYFHFFPSTYNILTKINTRHLAYKRNANIYIKINIIFMTYKITFNTTRQQKKRK